MANPQWEEGYTKIANEILEALCKNPIGFGNASILYAIIRKTYGWHKREDNISLSQLSEMTGMSIRNTIYCLQNLEAKKMIIIKRNVGRGHKKEINTISFNKNYNEWVVQERSTQYKKAIEIRKNLYKTHKQKVVQEKEVVQETPNLVVQEKVNDSEFLAHTKETITKEKKHTKDKPVATGTDEAFKYFCETYEKKVGKKYIASFAKDKAILKDLLKVIPITELTGLINGFFDSQDSFIIQSGYTIGAFKSQINKLRTQPIRHLTPQQRETVRGMKELEKQWEEEEDAKTGGL